MGRTDPASDRATGPATGPEIDLLIGPATGAKTGAPTGRESSVPSGRWARLARMGTLATGLAGGMLAEGARQWSQGQRPSARDLLLTPGNAKRVAGQLAQLRGAAMKVGQLLSMDAGELLPPALGEILATLRSDARPMLIGQVDDVLTAGWGSGWDERFSQFSFTPLAAASIGQVHRATAKDGRDLTIKIQYPGIRQSIDSDVDNVGTLLRISGLLPRSMDLAPLLLQAKAQLHEEADYLREADCLRQYAGLLADRPEYLLPAVYTDWTTENILTMGYVGGAAIESLSSAPQTERDRIVSLLMELLFRELFEFHLIQTDPNFANYQLERATGRIILLDFGATRAYPRATVDAYRQLMRGALRSDRHAIGEAAQSIGYFGDAIHAHQREAVVALFDTACEPLREAGAYDFANSNLAARIRDAGMALSMEHGHWHTPPADALFLHRKLGGLYLLATRLQARVPVQRLALPFLGDPNGSAPLHF